ncbi:MAG: Gfo/Idh/MocA family oxidoreductase [Pseudomonadota bacterium]
MIRPVRYAIAGTGMMGQEHIRNIALLSGAEVAALYEPDPEQLAMAKGLVPAARTADSFAALAADPAIDCLLIASPNHLHVGQLEEVLALRNLPVLVEKPLYTDDRDGARLAAIQERHPAVWVAMEYRYMPPIATLLAKAEEVTGGIKMLTIREHRFPFLTKVGDWNRFNCNTGGTLVEKCCHFFDLMRLALGSEPVRVMASADQAVNHLDERIGGQVPDIWDHGYVIVDFASGARALLELCMFAEGARFQEEISAVGPAGKIEAFVPGPTRFWPDHLGDAPTPQVVLSPRSPKGPKKLEIPVDPSLLEAGDHNGSTYYQHQRFLEVVRGSAVPEVTLADGAIAVRMGLAAQASARSGQAVALSVVRPG